VRAMASLRHCSLAQIVVCFQANHRAPMTGESKEICSVKFRTLALLRCKRTGAGLCNDIDKRLVEPSICVAIDFRVAHDDRVSQSMF
jgi:hypothetical protein